MTKTARITRQNEEGRKLDALNVSVSNGSAELCPECWTMVRQDGYVTITTKGSEQEDTMYSLHYQ